MADEDNNTKAAADAEADTSSNLMADEFVEDPEKLATNNGIADTERTRVSALDVTNGDVDNGKTAEELLEEDIPWWTRFKQVFWTYLPLGFVAFGGPQAHVAILRDHLVVQRNWLDEEQFTELFAIGQGLPGPTSTQLVVSTALARAGPIGGLTAFFLWNLPGLVVLTVCGVLIATFVDPTNPPWYLVGLAPAAVSLVFKAFYGFGKKLDKLGYILCLISTLIAIMINGSQPKIDPMWSQYIYPSMLACGGIISYIDSIRGTDKILFGRTFRVPGQPYGTYNSASKGWDAESDLTMRRIGIPIWVGALIWVVWAVVLAVTISIVGRMRRNGETPNVYLEIFGKFSSAISFEMQSRRILF